LVRGSFGPLEERVRAAGLAGELDGVLLDLGVSSPQLDEALRGFSFMQDGPLDMRMDNESGQSAAQWLAKAGEREIADVIRGLGEERFARRIARAIVAARATAPVIRTGELAAIVAAAVPTREPGKHPATRTFQAIRIHLNGELEALQSAFEGVTMPTLPDPLSKALQDYSRSLGDSGLVLRVRKNGKCRHRRNLARRRHEGHG
jgi:16S rRNA (cytosine1402-N4)-methyltransferase